MKYIADIKLSKKTAVEFEFPGTLEEFVKLHQNDQIEHLIYDLESDLESMNEMEVRAFEIEVSNVMYNGAPWMITLEYADRGVTLHFTVNIPFNNVQNLNEYLTQTYQSFPVFILHTVENQCRTILPAGMPNILVRCMEPRDAN